MQAACVPHECRSHPATIAGQHSMYHSRQHCCGVIGPCTIAKPFRPRNDNDFLDSTDLTTARRRASTRGAGGGRGIGGSEDLKSWDRGRTETAYRIVLRGTVGGRDGTYVCVARLAIQPKQQMWTHWDLNPGPSACEADVIPLHHEPMMCC